MMWCLIIEVLSDSTQSFDRNGKFNIYRNLPLLQEYILVSQNKIQIEHFNPTFRTNPSSTLIINL